MSFIPAPQSENPTGIRGIEFLEFASQNPEALHKMFLEFGFSRTMRHQTRAVDLYEQGDIRFLVNREPKSFAADFEKSHGPCVCGMAWRFENPKAAHETAVTRGATAKVGDHTIDGTPLLGLSGIGDSLIYMVGDKDGDLYRKLGFVALETPDRVPSKGFEAIDHLTNNVFKGTMKALSDFYKSVFGFVEVRYFDIRGAKTGLTSYALRSPCGTFSIPINEGTEAKSQINEYLEEYRGPGVQHIALRTNDMLSTMKKLRASNQIAFLDMDEQYYQELWAKFPNVTEDRKEVETNQVLIDGDEEGYLLQIFTKNLIGPIFFEVIQRKNHHSFGEGNFGALFRSIERDQMKRGYLQA
jgi:4-hydroxyphenylpyruvate dioxygenase